MPSLIHHGCQNVIWAWVKINIGQSKTINNIFAQHQTTLYGVNTNVSMPPSTETLLPHYAQPQPHE